MALEADALIQARDSRAHDAHAGDGRSGAERRVRIERRGRERRKGGRLNRVAPRASKMQKAGVIAVGAAFAVLVMILIAGETLFDGAMQGSRVVAGGALAAAVVLFLAGCLEQRLIEIRLELMMLNGGMREGDRRRSDRRTPEA